MAEELSRGQLNIKAPKPLNITSESMVNEWKLWKQQYNFYEIASQMKIQSPEVQVATFMTIIGPEALAIYNTFKLERENDLNEIKDKFEKYFIPKLNITYERYVFNTTVQKHGECFDEFLTNLMNKSKTCELGDLRDSLITDRIILGVNESKLREKLLSQDDLDLNKAVKICRAQEQTTKHLGEMKKEDNVVNIVKSKSHQHHETFDCKRCGRMHGKQQCKAFKHQCENCGRKGHFEKQCWSKKNKKRQEKGKVNSVEEADDEVLFVNAIGSEEDDEDWYETIFYNNKPFNVKLDTGAQCNVMPLSQLRKLNKNLSLRPSVTKRLIGITNDSMRVVGEVELPEKRS